MAIYELSSHTQCPAQRDLKIAAANLAHKNGYMRLQDCDIVALQECPDHLYLPGLEFQIGNQKSQYEKMGFMVKNGIDCTFDEVEHDYLLVGFWHVCVDADVQRDKVQNGVYRFRFQNRRSNRTQCKGMLYEKPDLRRS